MCACISLRKKLWPFTITLAFRDGIPLKNTVNTFLDVHATVRLCACVCANVFTRARANVCTCTCAFDEIIWRLSTPDLLSSDHATILVRRALDRTFLFPQIFFSSFSTDETIYLTELARRTHETVIYHLSAETNLHNPGNTKFCRNLLTDFKILLSSVKQSFCEYANDKLLFVASS